MKINQQRNNLLGFLFIFLIFMNIQLTMNQTKPKCTSKFTQDNILDPTVLKPYMFKTQISGKFQVLTPYKQNTNSKGKIISEQYKIEMVKTKQQMLPRQLFNETTIYAYAGQTKSGYRATFPGPMILATKDRPINVIWKNNIKGSHILPVDFNYPFESSPEFHKEVPAVPHAHGIATVSTSDGQSFGYWTYSGVKGSSYYSEQNRASNEATFKYPNQQEAGNYWVHDHTIGITRLNIYAGLITFYKIIEPDNKYECLITDKHGDQVRQSQTKYLIVTDKFFTKDGQLFYPQDTQNPNFSSWVPQLFGNTMLVNGVVWPKMTLKNGKHRFVILNACQDRFMNVFFENSGNKLPIQLIRIDRDYFKQEVIVSEIKATVTSRIQFIIDLAKVVGQIIVKNDAPAPFPGGEPQNFNPQFTGQILKLIVKNQQNICIDEKGSKKNVQKYNKKLNYPNVPYPYFSPGQKVFTTLFEVSEGDQIDGMFIDGISMMNSMDCKTSTYKVGQIYDFQFINLTEDQHPIHFHFVNMQKIKQWKFDVDAYSQKYFIINGGKPDKMGFQTTPTSLDPEEFRTGDDELPEDQQKVFRDTIDVKPGYITVMRIKFSKNDGTQYKSFELRGSRYVFHCHNMEHEDNQMMRFYCLE